MQEALNFLPNLGVRDLLRVIQYLCLLFLLIIPFNFSILINN